jgi:hypothetical protein
MPLASAQWSVVAVTGKKSCSCSNAVTTGMAGRGHSLCPGPTAYLRARGGGLAVLIGTGICDGPR